MSPLLVGMRRFARLPPNEKATLAVCFVMLPVFWACLRLFDLRRVQDYVSSRRRSSVHFMSVPEIQRLGTLVNAAASRSPFPATCLSRSLLLVWLLRGRGVDAELRIGVRLDPGFSAHAWVECDGTPVNDRAEVVRDFAVMPGARISSRDIVSP